MILTVDGRTAETVTFGEKRVPADVVELPPGHQVLGVRGVAARWSGEYAFDGHVAFDAQRGVAYVVSALPSDAKPPRWTFEVRRVDTGESVGTPLELEGAEAALGAVPGLEGWSLGHEAAPNGARGYASAHFFPAGRGARDWECMLERRRSVGPRSGQLAANASVAEHTRAEVEARLRGVELPLRPSAGP